MSNQEEPTLESSETEELLPTENEPLQPKQIQISDVDLKKLQHELMEYKDKYLRLLAEQENMRKRQQKEKLDQMRFATENLVIDFLRPIDNLENALAFAKDMSEEVKNWALGFQMILTQFKDVLVNNGVKPFESQGKVFDPHLHEAVEITETDDHPAGFVIKEFIKGYDMNGRTIRPARVEVSKPSVKQKTDLPENEEELN